MYNPVTLDRKWLRLYNQTNKRKGGIPMNDISSRLLENLRGDTADYQLPFLWLHGEDDETLLRELQKIYDCGIRGVCVESRPHEGFGTDSWWADLDLILGRCRELGMDLWLLDDKHFPTGYANGLLDAKYPERRKKTVCERHTDVRGPVNGGAVLVPPEAEDILSVTAYRRVARPGTQDLEPEFLDLTDRVRDGLIPLDLPEGIFRIFTVYTRVCDDHHIDVLSDQSVDVLLEAVYEPHYARYGSEFGKTFKGFFSDEPYILRNSRLALRGGVPDKDVAFPWNGEVEQLLTQKLGRDCRALLPTLWWNTPGLSPTLRTAYMDTVSALYSANFNRKIQAWCHARGAAYIGHIVEDDGQHCGFLAGGHYFRSLDGMDMAGVDVVLDQIVPGLQDVDACVPCSYDIADPDFFSFSLAKLAASHAHVQPEKQGRVLCEMFGAFGWAEGTKMMKWLADHMIVRGVNRFVPHAFSPKEDDPDCPPHFYAGGANPQYPAFGLLTRYADRQIHLTSAGECVPGAAILYHAEAEWSGGQYDTFYAAARLLAENQLEFDILSCDYLLTGQAENRRLRVGNTAFSCLIVPESEYLPRTALEKMKALAECGVPVLWLGRKTEKAADCRPFDPDFGTVVVKDGLASYVRREIGWDIALSAPFRGMRYLHRRSGGTELYMLFNEDVENTFDGEITFSAGAGPRLSYDAWTGKLTRCADRHVTLAPYETRFYLFGAEVPADPAPMPLTAAKALSLHWTVTADGRTWETDTLTPLSRTLPRFGGTAVYRTVLPETGGRVLDLGNVGETAEVLLGGKSLGVRIAPPYRFDLPEGAAGPLEVRVTTNLGFARRDRFSRYLLLEPTGLLGPVTVRS